MEPLGYIGYFSGLKTYDWPGMSSREVPEASKLLGTNWRDLIIYLKPDWLVLRANSREDLPQLSPMLAEKLYEKAKDFDRRADIEKLDISGRNLLLFDSHFAVYRRRNPMSFTFEDRLISPESHTALFGVSRVNYQERDVVFAHAPSSFTFKQNAKINQLTGKYGLLDEAWNGPKTTAGAIFEIEQIHSDHTKKILFSKTLRPRDNPADREIQSFNIAVPTRSHAKIQFITRPAHPQDVAFNYTYWHDIKAEVFSSPIAWRNGTVTSIDSNAPNGFAIMEEGGSHVVFAHVPSRLDYPIPEGARQFSGKIGILRRAYTGEGTTDGATFKIESENSEGIRTVLYQCLLEPLTIAEDRGAQPFSIDLPKTPARKLILSTELPPSGRLDYGWSFWQDLQLD
jgi:hypothetical protein